MASTFPTTKDSFIAKIDSTDYPVAQDVNDLQEAITALETKVGITSSGDTASLDYKVNNFFATGRKLWLYEDTAPTGWTLTGVSDAVLAVKGGSNAYNASGGTAQGTWTQPTHTHGSGSYTAESHNHKWFVPVTIIQPDATFNSSGNQVGFGSGLKANSAIRIPISTSSSVNHPSATYYTNNKSPAVSGTSGTGATSATYRPYATVGIIVTKS